MSGGEWKDQTAQVFGVGQRVEKPKGYPYPGRVVAVFANRAGDVRLVVESELAPGMLHIFAPSQLIIRPELPTQPTATQGPT